MSDGNLVWYVGYGSNILKERFLCYIKGGQPEGSSKTHEGCRDKSLPIDDKPTILNHELYFAKNSSSWQNGGIGFVNMEENNAVLTLARMYLVTRQQLEDIAKQETDSAELVSLNLEEAITHGYTIFKSPSWYGNLLYLGEHDQHPVFTLTSECIFTKATQPGIEYLTTIIKGIQQTHGLTTEELVGYLMGKRGVNGNYTADELSSLIKAKIK